MSDLRPAKDKHQALLWRLPLIFCLFLSFSSGYCQSPPSADAQSPDPVRRVNAPHFDEQVPFSEMATLWFGQVNNTDNYADVRVGYNDEYLRVNITAFDRYLWYDTTPGSDLDEWDAATLYLDLEEDGGGAPATDDYRLVAQINWWEVRSNYQKAFRGDGNHWMVASTAFTTTSGWRGTNLNRNGSDNDDRGWTLNFYIPFASLGLPGPPADGDCWGMALAMHDRDDAVASSPIADKTWPEDAQDAQPDTWGQLVFNPPAYQRPPAFASGTAIIRHKLNGAIVTDAAVGGHTDCGNGLDFWNEWGDANYAGGSPVNIQNQSDVADWPCFSKYYVTFPLNALPPGKVIISATLTLHQIGSAGEPDQRQPSLIQVLTVDEAWGEATLTWNNAPLARENVSSAWVDPTSFPGWPGLPREWDVSSATAQAYHAGIPLRLVLYEADSAYHSGKYFVSCDTGDWNAVGRPTLTVLWGNSQPLITKQVWPASTTNGDLITYTLRWLGSGQPLTMTDNLPNGLSAPGPISASTGSAHYNPSARQIAWTGIPANGQAVTITFPVTVQVGGPLALYNTAVLSAGNLYLSSDTALVIIDGYPIYLPQIVKP